jgi:hypothetical protein
MNGVGNTWVGTNMKLGRGGIAGPAAIIASCMLVCGAGCATSGKPSNTVLGYVTRIPPESASARAERHRQVARRRAGLPIIVHRGAWHAAPENTLEAYAEAMDLGADGVEIDVRRTADGVLYLFHDDTLERLTKATGRVDGRTYFELLRVTPKLVYGRATPETRPPTLSAFLVLARQRAMLIHLDIKEPGLEDAIARLLDEANVWDHVVHINDRHADRLRSHPRARLLEYAGWVPDEAEPSAIRRFCAEARRTGQMVFCDDPRPAVRALGRWPPEAVPLPDGIRAGWTRGGVAGRPAPEPTGAGDALHGAR